ncbi:glutamyl-tRNA reductase [Burkholderia mayonis]|uniref:glutamyl-tRNA reductase n=1 Tax=Burkholderia mayonis TaxID=1385591 RepID=UPI001CF7C3F5|nr:glutamyl-tRNA reductase [Burkholderia mayonis]
MTLLLKKARHAVAPGRRFVATAHVFECARRSRRPGKARPARFAGHAGKRDDGARRRQPRTRAAVRIGHGFVVKTL